MERIMRCLALSFLNGINCSHFFGTLLSRKRRTDGMVCPAAVAFVAEQLPTFAFMAGFLVISYRSSRLSVTANSSNDNPRCNHPDFLSSRNRKNLPLYCILVCNILDTESTGSFSCICHAPALQNITGNIGLFLRYSVFVPFPAFSP